MVTPEQAPEIRLATILIVDIAGTVGLRSRIGDAEAERRIRALLDTVFALARARGGQLIKSYGDDVLAAFEGEAISAAAETAVAAQHAAAAVGLQLYAGLHAGPVEFRETMGHPDAVGLTVSIAARLHKLTEGVPGRIHLLESAVAQLSAGLRDRASLFAVRELKGLGLSRVWILEWEERPTLPATLLVTSTVEPPAVGTLQLRHGDCRLVIPGDGSSAIIGRGKECALRLDDPELRISSMHLQIERVDNRWFVKDISRNGTWMHDAQTGTQCQLPQAMRVELPSTAELCLGRSFADDSAARYRVEIMRSDAAAV